jgi:hypothetical protein
MMIDKTTIPEEIMQQASRKRQLARLQLQTAIEKAKQLNAEADRLDEQARMGRESCCGGGCSGHSGGDCQDSSKQGLRGIVAVTIAYSVRTGQPCWAKLHAKTPGELAFIQERIFKTMRKSSYGRIMKSGGGWQPQIRRGGENDEQHLYP